MGNIFAQPIADYANVHLTVDYQMYSAKVSSIGNPGANVVLDLSQVAFVSMNIKASFISYSSATAYYTNFLSSNLCSIDNNYNYLILSKNSLVKIGQQNASSMTKYIDPEVLIIFPMHYLDTYVDIYTSTDGSNNGRVTLKYEAYGTLKTQFGTVENVITINRGNYHEFWTSNPLRNLAQWDASKSTFYYYNLQTTGISTVLETSFSVYPTMVNDNLYFLNRYDIKNVQIINTSNQIVLTKMVTSDNLNLSALSKGIYLISVEINGTTLHSKIVKQ